MTSHDVVSRLRYHLSTKKVGHAGTLDPMATGLLIMGVGQGTKLLTHAVGLDKTYEATIRLGSATLTDDAEGEFVGEWASPAALTAVTDAAIAEGVSRLRGNIEQVPSAVSAIKVNGQRSYARVRAGEDVALKARPITVSRFEVREIRRGSTDGGSYIDIDAVIDCSSGTYIRALARDLGAHLGVGGHLTALRRTRVGQFSVDSAQQVPERDTPKASEAPEAAITLTPLAHSAASLLPVVAVTADNATALRYGQWIDAPDSGYLHVNTVESDQGNGAGADGGITWPAAAIVPSSGVLVALLEPARGGKLKPVLVFPPLK